MASIPNSNRRADLLVALGLAALVFAAHGAALWDGLFFDDHLHRVALRASGSSFDELIESATVDLPGRIANLWWQDRPLQWRYARPVAIAVMKIEYWIADGDPASQHAFGLLWHWMTGFLVYRLALCAVPSRRWAFFAAVLFVVNPHSTFAVSWIAARNTLVSTFFLLAALLAYHAASIGSAAGRAARSTQILTLALLLWLAALLSRETAIVFAPLALVLDAAFAGRGHIRERWPAHAAIWVIAATYLFWRLAIFPTGAAPAIYFAPAAGAVAANLLHLLFAMVFYTPMVVGLGRSAEFGAAQIATFAVMIALLLAVGLLYRALSRETRGRWFWPLCVVASFGPVTPVFMMPHFAYLPFAAYAVMVAIMLSSLRGRARAVVTTFVLLSTIGSLMFYRVLWRGMLRSEQLVFADIRASMPAPPPPGSKLYLVDLPVIGIYAAVALREAWDVEDLEAHVLTFASHPLMMEQASTVQPLNNRELIVTTAAPGFFSGLSGRMMLDGLRSSPALRAGERVRGDQFDVTVLEADQSGVTRLKFSFHQPLDAPNVYVYVSTPDRPAYRLRFDRPAVDPAPHTPQRARMLAERRRYFDIIHLARKFIRSDLLLTSGADPPK